LLFLKWIKVLWRILLTQFQYKISICRDPRSNLLRYAAMNLSGHTALDLRMEAMAITAMSEIGNSSSSSEVPVGDVMYS